jgi:hypothetical protein
MTERRLDKIDEIEINKASLLHRNILSRFIAAAQLPNLTS